MAERIQRFVDLRIGGVARLNGLDRPEGFLDDAITWCRGERRIGDPVTTEQLALAIVGLARAHKDPVEALASLAAAAVQRLVA